MPQKSVYIAVALHKVKHMKRVVNNSEIQMSLSLPVSLPLAQVALLQLSATPVALTQVALSAGGTKMRHNSLKCANVNDL